MQNKTPILVITGLAIVALAGVAGLTRDRWMGHSPEVVAIAPEPPKPAEPPAAPAAPAEAPAEQPAATAEQTPSPPPAPAVAQNQTPAPAAEATPPAAPAPAATETQPAQQAVATPPEQPAATNSAETAKVPSFDTVRVEKTGEAVIAGTAPAGSDVVVKLDGKAIGETTANSEGAFVVVPEQPLPAGSGALTIEAKGKSDAQATQSKQSVAVIVPAADQPQEALVAVVSPDQPTRVLQKPAAPEAVAPASTTETANTETKGDAATAPAPAQPATAEKPAKMVSIDAVDYDPTGNIVFSGQGEAGNTARLYIDNNNLGDAAVGADGRWTYSGTADVAPGVHSLRVDGLDSAGKVLNRVEVPFFREQQSKVAQIVPKAAEPAETAPAAAPDVVAPKAADATAPAAPAAPVPAAPVPAAPAQAAPVAAAPAPAAPVAAAPAETPDTASDGSAAAPAAPAAADEPATADEPGMAPSAPAQPPAAPVATAEPPEGRIVIQPGNNLWRISRVLYGTGARFTTLYEANKDQIRNPNLIYPGQVFKTPDVSAEGGTVDPKRREPLNAGTGQ